MRLPPIKLTIEKTDKLEASREPELTDEELFAQAMQGVSLLQPDNHVSLHDQTQLQKTARNKLKKIRQQNRQKDFTPLKAKALDSTLPISAFERLAHHEEGLRQQELRKLKTSHFKLEACLDLHGKTAEQADDAIEMFLQQAIACQMKYVRIIHGKGYNSNSEFPILKNLCYQKLKTFTAIVGFCSTPEKDGGVGAVNIQLRQH